MVDAGRPGAGPPGSDLQSGEVLRPHGAEPNTGGVTSAGRIDAVVYEDRPGQLVGVKLLVLSAAEHTPALHLSVICPAAPAAFAAWVAAQPNAELVDVPIGGATGWNVKPAVLLDRLSGGAASVVWLDSDLILARDVTRMLTRLPGALLATEDWWYARGHDSAVRTQGWDMPVGRVLRRPVNTAVLRAEPGHRELLVDWARLTSDPRYLRAQSRPHSERPLHLMGDQEVLGALLGSRRWSGTDLEVLRRGTDIAQCFGAAGFSPAERVRVRFSEGVPGFVHAMGTKPWLTNADGRPPPGTALSPYAALAARYASTVGESMPWVSDAGWLTRIADRLTGGDPVLRQLGPAVVEAGIWSARRAGGRIRRRLSTTS